MTYNDRLNYLFASNFKTGTINVFDVGKPGREKYVRCIAHYAS